MNGDWSHEQDSESSSSSDRMVGGALMAAGVVLAGWVVNVIYHIFMRDGSADVVSNLIPREILAEFIQTSGGAMDVPDSGFYMIGLMASVFLLAICAGIAKALIANGVRIFRPSADEVLKQVHQELERIKRFS